MLRDGGIDLTNELVMRFTKMLPREAGIELIASSNLEGEMLREAVKNLDERFERLCDGRCTVQFDHKTDDLMKLLRKLKDAGIITRYWFDKKTSKLNASSSFRAIDSQG